MLISKSKAAVLAGATALSLVAATACSSSKSSSPATTTAAAGSSAGTATSSAGATSSASSANVAKSITVWTSSNVFWDYQKANLGPFEQQTGIKVNFTQIPGANILDKEALAQRAKSSSFAMYEGPTSLLAQNVSLLGGVDVKKLISDPSLTSSDFNFADFGKGGIQDCTLKGTLYCLPVFDDGGVLAYNKKIFTQAGITKAPTTWDEVVTDADTITSKTGTPGWCTRGSEAGAAIATANQMLSYFIPWSAANQGFFVGPKWNSLLDSPGALKWANLYQHLMTKDAPKGIGSYQYTNCSDDFDHGKVAMDWDGFAVFAKSELNPPAGSALKGNNGFSEITCPTSDPCVATGPWGMYLNPHASTPQQNAAWKLMQYLDSPAFLTKEIAATGTPALAVRTSTTKQAFAGVPASFLAAEQYVADHSEPNPFPPSQTFNESQNTYQTSISNIVSGSSVTKQMAAAAAGQNSVFKQAGLQK